MRGNAKRRPLCSMLRFPKISLRKSEFVLYFPQSLDRGVSSAETAAATSLARLNVKLKPAKGAIAGNRHRSSGWRRGPLHARNRIGFEADAHVGRFCKFASFLPPDHPRVSARGPTANRAHGPSASRLRPDGIGRNRRESVGNDAARDPKVAPAHRFLVKNDSGADGMIRETRLPDANPCSTHQLSWPGVSRPSTQL